LPAQQLVVYAQNHDQVGNRQGGERLSALVPFEALKVAAAAVIFSPFIPMLFMGEEFGEESPFLYFMSFSDNKLIENVRQGRKNEFKAFGWKGEPADPYDQATFQRCKLRWDVLNVPAHKTLFLFYQHIISLRKNIPALSCRKFDDFLDVKVFEEQKMLKILRRQRASEIKIILNFSHSANSLAWNHLSESWKLILDTSDQLWLGPGRLLPDVLQGGETITINPLSLVCYERQQG